MLQKQLEGVSMVQALAVPPLSHLLLVSEVVVVVVGAVIMVEVLSKCLSNLNDKVFGNYCISVYLCI